MAKLRLTKNELKKQKDALKMFLRYLPALLLKKQQLQTEIIKIQNNIQKIEEEMTMLNNKVSSWISVFGEDVGLKALISIKNIITQEGNIAGVDIPIFEGVEFTEKEYSFLDMPIWVDYGIEAIKEMIVLNIKVKTLNKQLKLIREELRITTQRVNLFEKIKIPQAKDNIRKIGIWLGDLQTAAVVTGKIAKDKIQKKEAVLV
ncbi:MAG: V-type ATP synthase subunit D [Candidatus Omnitrophica bacterium]|nr:V-type ATP synthase subunit D [Candidatus Omnitrophota bacterium]